MEKLNVIIRSNKFFKHTLFISCITCVILFNYSCNDKKELYNIAEFTGAGDLVNYSKTPLGFVTDSLHPAALLCNKGDLIVLDEFVFIKNDDFSGNKFNVYDDDSAVYVNNHIYALYIPDSTQMIPWFKNLKNKDLSTLQFLYFEGKIPEDYYPYLAEIAKIKPDAGIFFEDNPEDISKLFDFFQPRYLMVLKVANNYELLSKLTNLETLWISLEDSVVNNPLPALPKLKQIFLQLSGKENAVVTNELLINNKQIEKVVFQNSMTVIDLAILSPLNNLKELVIGMPDSISNLDLINKHKNLEVLSLSGEDLDYNTDIIRLPALRWIAFNANITQDKFDSFITANPDLEVVELVENDTIRSFLTLSKLRMLYGLTVTDSVMDMTTIKTLKNLKYLSLPTGILKDTVARNEIQHYLPNTLIAANDGYLCLGSGWLLLLAPLVLLFRFLRKYNSKISIRKN